MKKIPTLFKRVFDENHNKSITKEVTPGCEVVLEGALGGSIATVKYDGACCAIIDGEIYRRYDAKQKYGKKPPEGAIPCQTEPDPITGHWPHWVKCIPDNPADKYFIEAFERSLHLFQWGAFHGNHLDGKPDIKLPDGTYEAIGPSFQGNPYNMSWNRLERHGKHKIGWSEFTDENGTVGFECIHDYLANHKIEGIVFWNKGQPLCKIKRSDFGFEWPIRNVCQFHFQGIERQGK